MDIIVVLLTGLGTIIAIAAINAGLIAWLRADSKAFEQEIRGWTEEIKAESKDFHGRLEKLDAEFKGMMALQDAEFKAHMVYYHSHGNVK
jgi:hypothetical protein